MQSSRILLLDQAFQKACLLHVSGQKLKQCSPISYLDQILAENQRLKERSTTSAQVAETNDLVQRWTSLDFLKMTCNMLRYRTEALPEQQMPLMEQEFKIH